MIAAATLLLSACASNGYAGGYGQYPDQAYYPNGYYNQGGGYYNQGGYYGYDPYYYGNGGYAHVDDDDHDRWFRPEKGVVCDRAQDICYNQRGPSYEDSKQYFGKKDAKKAFDRLQDQGALFSPQHGVTCDRSRGVCYDSHGVDEDLSRRYFGPGEPNATRMLNSNGKSNNTHGDQDEEWWLNQQRPKATPLLNNNGNSSQNMIPQRPQHLADNDDNVRWIQPQTHKPDHQNRPASAAPILRPTVIDPPANRSGGGANAAGASGSGGSATCLLNCNAK